MIFLSVLGNEGSVVSFIENSECKADYTFWSGFGCWKYVCFLAQTPEAYWKRGVANFCGKSLLKNGAMFKELSLYRCCSVTPRCNSSY